MKYSFTIGLCLTIFSAFSQTVFYNNGETVFINDGAEMIVKTGDYENANGITENNGQLTVEGNYINDDQTTGGIAGSEFIIEENWENNQNFNAGNSNVIMDGTTQLITGTSVSTFYDLTLQNASVKTQTLDSEVSNILTLDDSELQTMDFKMTVLNPDVLAIDFMDNSGFVSSTNDGRLVRNTNSNGTYIFPVGEINNGLKYRPIEISPSTASDQQFETRVVYNDATVDGYPTANLDGDVENVNTNFFHFIQQTLGTDPAALTIYYDNSFEGDWSEIARYEDTNLWTSLDNGAPTPSMLEGVTKADWQNNTNEPHILANLRDIVEDEEPLFAVPNAFSPLGSQAENTVFGIINQKGAVELEYMQVFNRWGEEVFNSEAQGIETWDGSHEGELQPTGNYVYLIKMRKTATGESMNPISGNILMIW